MPKLTTKEQIKALVTASPADDSLLDELALAAHDYVVASLGFDPITTSYTVTLNGNGRSQIILAHSDVTAVASVTVNDRSIPAAANIFGSGYRFNKIGVVTLNGYSFERGFDNVVIAYTAGVAEYPHDLMLAASEMAALRFKTRQNIGIQSKTLAQETIVFTDKDLTDYARSVIRHYGRKYNP